MQKIVVKIKIQNGSDFADHRKGLLIETEIRQLEIAAAVDPKCVMFCINEHIFKKLGLQKMDERLKKMPDGQLLKLPVSSSVIVWVEDRWSCCGALVLPDDSVPILGMIPLCEMDLKVDFEQGILAQIHPGEWLMRI